MLQVTFGYKRPYQIHLKECSPIEGIHSIQSIIPLFEMNKSIIRTRWKRPMGIKILLQVFFM